MSLATCYFRKLTYVSRQTHGTALDYDILRQDLGQVLRVYAYASVEDVLQSGM